MARDQFIKRNPLCIGCLAAFNDPVPTEVVDHVEPHKGDTAKFWNSELWQASCDWHHKTVKAQLEALYAQGRAKLADLWLNSPRAIKLSLLLKRQG
ncbi:hypothetical protein IZ6_07650 [Terrihabitans soli]|uniref:HNH endonuclease n=1 Tax=Terrihabitans soli TaxID=708113 RepID=A0A6S6QSW7_9HYPH|nr:hypothetical protein [Terrihabitans soli]BCJ90030.1 hypothetical protein IZ6_07650 [Terrihabitans soli]